MNENMKKAREAAGLSQKQVAITLDVSAPTVSEWESGKKFNTAKRYCNAFTVPFCYSRQNDPGTSLMAYRKSALQEVSRYDFL